MSNTNKHSTCAGRTLSASRNGRRPLPSLPDYVFTDTLGSGTYATVYKAFKKSGSREIVAIKCVLKKTLNKASTENLLTEIEILKQLKHEHIVQLKDFEWDQNYIYIIMEFCGGGDLSSFLKLRRALHETTVRKFLQQLALALQYMREKNVSHLDLKPQNILLTSATNPKLKVADFGFAHYLIGDVETSYLKGSPLYMAPEIICSKHYDVKADLWSVGVILYECLFGQAPWASNSLAELAEKIKENKAIEIPSGFQISSECRDLILRLLTRNPSERISFEEFFAHPFLQLDRVPSESSLPKAIELVELAIREDKSGNLSGAIDLYVKALDHFIAALHYESNEDKKEKMREKIKQYLERTEHLRHSLEDSLSSGSVAIYDYEEMKQLASSHAQLPTILDMQSKATEFEKAGNYEKALERHKKSIQSLLSIAPHLVEGRLRELLHIHIKNSLNHAEKLDEYCKVRKTEQVSQKTFTQSMKETCHVQ